MGSTTAFVGDRRKHQCAHQADKERIYQSIGRLAQWLEESGYRGYDTFDGLNARFVRFLTFETKLLRTTLQQGVRRFPLNLRPALGITREYSSKGMGFLARGFIRLHKATRDQRWHESAKFALQWLIDNQSPGYSGACWGNHFDYQSRGFYLPKSVPTVVWTSLIGHAFLDAYEHFNEPKYLQIAISACEHILCDLQTFSDGKGLCITYVPGLDCRVHNANVLGAGFLARTYAHTQNDSYCELARKALQYTAQYQRYDSSWYYGEKENLHWVDNFHTAYVLDSFRHYALSTGDNQFEQHVTKGYAYWKETFFLPDGTPRYYNHKTLPIDIQCCSQAIDTLVFFHSADADDNVRLALSVANWTITNMQDKSGYFYYRRYTPWLVNKTATLHWGQATMMSALAGLYHLLQEGELQR
jgi:rhamnogalacturonyl hydrolase YesR